MKSGAETSSSAAEVKAQVKRRFPYSRSITPILDTSNLEAERRIEHDSLSFDI